MGVESYPTQRELYAAVQENPLNLHLKDKVVNLNVVKVVVKRRKRKTRRRWTTRTPRRRVADSYQPHLVQEVGSLLAIFNLR